MKKAVIVGVLSIFVFTHTAYSQDRFDEFQKHADFSGTIIHPITEVGDYAILHLSEYKSTTGETYLIVISSPHYHKQFIKKEVGLIGGGKSFTPQLFMGSVSENIHVILIRIFSGGDIYGKKEFILVDSKNRKNYQVSLPDGYVSKIVPYNEGMIVEMEHGGYHTPSFVKIFSYISIVNDEVMIENYSRETMIEN